MRMYVIGVCVFIDLAKLNGVCVCVHVVVHGRVQVDNRPHTQSYSLRCQDKSVACRQDIIVDYQLTS